MVIVSEQTLKGKAPPKVISAMINNAREFPKPSRDKIADRGIQLLQLNPQSPLLVSRISVYSTRICLLISRSLPLESPWPQT